MGKGGAGGVTTGSEPSPSFWLNHRRCSLELRDKSWQLPRKAGKLARGHSSAFIAGVTELCRSGGVTRGAHVRRCGTPPPRPGQRCAGQRVPRSQLSSSPNLPEGESRRGSWCTGPALQRHPQGPSWASFNRFGERCLVRCLLSCSIANPG